MLDIKRLTCTDLLEARGLFTLMAKVFEEPSQVLSDQYLEKVLSDGRIWVLAAFVDQQQVAGLTAHLLPMTHTQSTEVMIYDLAVLETHQRQGIGGALIGQVRQLAAHQGIETVFVVVDNEDLHALDFYRKQHGQASPTTVFEF
jgi:aminoglycoside 3-N-acetyltransferase I